MKKLLTLSAVAVFAIGLTTSCKKDYTCTCKVSGMSDTVIPINKSSKKDAEAACELSNTTYALAGGSCSL